MSDILEEIVSKRRQTVKQLKQVVPMSSWEMMPLFSKECISLKKNLLDESLTGIIAEFKRASPSKGTINDRANIFETVYGYEKNKAAAVSILTEPVYFKGSNDDILSVAKSVKIPILRKDFILEEYQVMESKAIGADIILLIAACLSPVEVKRLAKFGKKLGLEILLEIHNENELDHICDEIDLIGVNNRNLKTFEVDINTSLGLISKIPTGTPAIAESGINNVETIVSLKQAGFKGFLIGETFMKKPDPTIAFAEFVKSLTLLRQ